MNEHSPMLAWLWPLLAALSGALTALALPQYRTLTTWGRIAVVFTGFVFAVFVGPLVVRWWFKGEDADSQAVGALYYLMSVTAMVVLPKVIDTISRRLDSTLLGMVKPAGGSND